MRIHSLSPTDAAKAVGIGVANALLLSAIMVPALRFGLSPLPEPLALAFAETVLGRSLPLPVGLAFHVAYVTVWSVAFVVLFRDRMTLARAVALGLVLWLGVLVIFFPVVGWGFLGLAVTAKLIVASLIPHVLFGVFLWGLARLAFAAPAS